MDPLAAELDILLRKLEEKARKALENFSRSGTLEKDTVSVRLEKIEIDCLVLAQQLDDAVRKVLQDDDRDVLDHVLGSPYIRLARMRYLLDSMAFSKSRELDRRWVAFRTSCDAVESVLRDLGGFRTWQELKKAGNFESAFEDPDADSEDSDSGNDSGDAPSDSCPNAGAKDRESGNGGRETPADTGNEGGEAPDADVRVISKNCLNTDSQNQLADWLQDAERHEVFLRDSHDDIGDAVIQEGGQTTSQIDPQSQDGNEVRDAAGEELLQALSQNQGGYTAAKTENEEVLIKTNLQASASDQLRPAGAQESTQMDSQNQGARINSRKLGKGGHEAQEAATEEVHVSTDLQDEAGDQLRLAGGQETSELVSQSQGGEITSQKLGGSQVTELGCEEASKRDLCNEWSAGGGRSSMAQIRSEMSVVTGSPRLQNDGDMAARDAQAECYASAQNTLLSTLPVELSDSCKERRTCKAEPANHIRVQARSQQQDQSVDADMDYFEGVRAGPRAFTMTWTDRTLGTHPKLMANPIDIQNSFQILSQNNPPMRFAAAPRGKNAVIEGCLLARRNLESKSFFDGIVSDVKNAAESRRQKKDYFHHDISGGWHGGGSAISAVPLWVYPGLGQFAEVRVGQIQKYRGTLGMGCVGIGVTQNEPDSLSYLTFPKKLNKLPGPTWLFAGPYHGRTRRFYVNGKQTYRYTSAESWNAGDRVAILVDHSGVLHLYINGKEVVSQPGPGMDKLDVRKQKLFLVAEAYGSVTSLSLTPRPDPSSLFQDHDASQNEDDDVIRTTLDDFLR